MIWYLSTQTAPWALGFGALAAAVLSGALGPRGVPLGPGGWRPWVDALLPGWALLSLGLGHPFSLFVFARLRRAEAPLFRLFGWPLGFGLGALASALPLAGAFAALSGLWIFGVRPWI